MIKDKGLMWIPDKITKAQPLVWQMRQATLRFQKRFGVPPTTCHMQSGDVPKDTEMVIKIVPDETITEGHWFLTDEVLE